MTSQRENAENIDLLSSYFPLRSEPNYALGNAVSNYLMLPNLRGFWPFSSVNESGGVIDLSGQGRTLTYSASPGYTTVGLVPVTTYNGTTQFLYRADEAGLDITAHLTLGCWIYPTDLTGVRVWLAKDDVGANRSYVLYTNGNQANFIGFGVGTYSSGASPSLLLNTWQFIAGRFTPNTESTVIVNGVKTSNLVGIGAALTNSGAQFRIGADSPAAPRFAAGNCALAFLCASACSDSIINNLYQQGRSLFGV